MAGGAQEKLHPHFRLQAFECRTGGCRCDAQTPCRGGQAGRVSGANKNFQILQGFHGVSRWAEFNVFMLESESMGLIMTLFSKYF